MPPLSLDASRFACSFRSLGDRASASRLLLSKLLLAFSLGSISLPASIARAVEPPVFAVPTTAESDNHAVPTTANSSEADSSVVGTADFESDYYPVAGTAEFAKFAVVGTATSTETSEMAVGGTVEFGDSTLRESLPLGRDGTRPGAHDIRFTLPDADRCDGCNRPIGNCGCGGLSWPRLGMYVKAGPSGQWSEGLFHENTSLGYQVAIGGRELLFPTNRRVFLDFGGSYLSAYGRGDPLTIGGSITRGTANPQRLNEFMDLTLEEISRAGLHAAIGWFYDVSPTPDDSRLITVRAGGRISHIHGHFREDATDALQAIIDTAVNAGQSFSLANDPAISKTDTAPGIFLGVELDHTRYLTPGATISFLVDGEFASDWIDLKNYADSAMVTATLMFGVSLSR